MKTSANLRLFLTALFAAVGFVLLSPKWTFAPAAWISPALLLIFMQSFKPMKAFLWGYLVLFVSGVVANYRVMPFPMIFFVIIFLKVCALLMVPYILYRLVAGRYTHWLITLVFPCTFVLLEYLNAMGEGQGTWGSIAYSQVTNIPLLQVAAFTGVWGISFLIYWFGSVFAWVIGLRFRWAAIKTPVMIYCTLMVIVLGGGAIRSNPYFNHQNETVRVVAITGNNLVMIRQIYEDAFGIKMNVDLDHLTQTSPEVQEMQKGVAAFIEKPYDSRFTKSHRAILAFCDSLFGKAAREANAGAKIIAFSEALMFTVKPDEDSLIAKGMAFSKQHGAYLLLTAAVILPGKMAPGKKFLENKSWLISPAGEIVNTFLKNKPVPIAEAGSVPGDGIVPVIHTSLGNIASSICYDADFPSLMHQAGEKKADILLLPSGDWKEISPYHAQMAMVRAVENGFSLLRPASGAFSIAADCYGRLIGSRDYYDQGEKVLVATLPAVGVRTIYAKVGDSFVLLCACIFVVVITYCMIRKRPNDLYPKDI